MLFMVFRASAWLIEGPPGSIIVLQFLDFEIEEADNCEYDRLVVCVVSMYFIDLKLTIIYTFSPTVWYC